MKTDGANPRVWSERSIEYQNLGMMQNAAGDRARALESFQKYQSIRQDILKNDPEYRNIRSSLATSSVLVGNELALLGSRKEALREMEAAIALYESALKSQFNTNIERDLAFTNQKRGDIQLMEGDFAGALASFHEARTMLEPMANADPQNSMLKLDMVGAGYEEGRILASTGKYLAAIPLLQRALKGFQGFRDQSSRSDDEITSDVGASYIWIGEAEAGAQNLREALENYKKGAAVLQSTHGEPVADDNLCELAISYTKTGDLLTRTGDLAGAAAAYEKSLEIVLPLVKPERKDVPALYAAADAYAGLGDLSVTRARRTSNARDRAKLWSDAREWCEKSLSTWQNIPNPSPINPLGFKAGDPHEIARRLADLKKRGAV